MNFDLKGKIVVVQRAKSSGIMRQRSNSQFAILQVLALALFVAAHLSSISCTAGLEILRIGLPSLISSTIPNPTR